MNHSVRAEVEKIDEQIRLQEMLLKDLKHRRRKAFDRCSHRNATIISGPLERYKSCPDCGWKE